MRRVFAIFAYFAVNNPVHLRSSPVTSSMWVRKKAASPPSQAHVDVDALLSLPFSHPSQLRSKVSANAPARCTSSTAATRST